MMLRATASVSDRRIKPGGGDVITRIIRFTELRNGAEMPNQIMYVPARSTRIYRVLGDLFNFLVTGEAIYQMNVDGKPR
jgi:hypothetical protein